MLNALQHVNIQCSHHLLDEGGRRMQPDKTFVPINVDTYHPHISSGTIETEKHLLYFNHEHKYKIQSLVSTIFLQSTMHHIPILNSHCKYKLWLLNKETSLKNYFNIAIIVPTCYSLHSNFYHQLYTFPYDSSRHQSIP